MRSQRIIIFIINEMVWEGGLLYIVVLAHV